MRRLMVSRCRTASWRYASGIPYQQLTVGIPKERMELEKRVAATPESVLRLCQPGFKVLVEDGAGMASYFNNNDYEQAGATIVSKEQVWKDSDIVLKVMLVVLYSLCTFHCSIQFCIVLFSIVSIQFNILLWNFHKSFGIVPLQNTHSNAT